MAHNLNLVNGKYSFATTQKAWHGLGQLVNGVMTAQQAIEQAGLGYIVEKGDVYTYIGDKQILIPEKYATYRKDTGDTFGIVGGRYEIVQNNEAFSFFDEIVGEGAAIYETAGALGKGEKVFITAKMPECIRIEGTDDLTEVYVILTNTHDGSGAVIAGITPVRIVCNNTLNAALNNMVRKVSIRHTTNVKSKLEQAHKVLNISHKAIEQYNELFNHLATIKVTDSQVQKLVEELFKSEKNDSTRILNIRDAVKTAYFTGAGQENILGTGWGFYNGVTHYLSHDKAYRDESSKFEALMDGTSTKVADKALELILDLK